ncbi:MAG: hypothetical protein HC880_07780 [Bacteroidia bacterium]|nr:hypothetical protein [Bacteroidia bacterium]
MGKNAHYSEKDLKVLMEFVGRGNTAFISATEFPLDLWARFGETTEEEKYEDEVENDPKEDAPDEEAGDKEDEEYYEDEDDEYYEDDDDEYYEEEQDYIDLEDCHFIAHRRSRRIICNFSSTNQPYPFQHRGFVEEDEYNWSYFNFGTCELGAEVENLGSFKNFYLNFVRIPYGEGYFYLHSSPILFTNYHLSEEKKLEYAQKVFAHLPQKTFYWDEFNKVLHQDDNDDRGPLEYILSQPSLRWAWYLMLAGVMLYFVFYSKRRQRAIPVLAAQINSSVDFAETIGRLYYQTENHAKLAKHQFNLWLAYIRRNYNMHSPEVELAFKERLSLKTGAPPELIASIFNTYDKLRRRTEVTREDLIGFYQLLDKFYTYTEHLPAPSSPANG